jgi:hypothetical protein
MGRREYIFSSMYFSNTARVQIPIEKGILYFSFKIPMNQRRHICLFEFYQRFDVTFCCECLKKILTAFVVYVLAPQTCFKDDTIRIYRRCCWTRWRMLSSWHDTSWMDQHKRLLLLDPLLSPPRLLCLHPPWESTATPRADLAPPPAAMQSGDGKGKEPVLVV